MPRPKDFEKFSKISPFKANEASVGVPVYKNWIDMRDAVMKSIMVDKFSDPVLKDKLVKTGSRSLIYANHWGDTYWGVNPQGEGQNQLGKILEEIRSSFTKTKTETIEEKVVEKPVDKKISLNPFKKSK